MHGACVAPPSDQRRGEYLAGVGDANVAKAIGRMRLTGTVALKMESPVLPRPD
jgi:hypothetical protein